jgi:hypothetical protein
MKMRLGAKLELMQIEFCCSKYELKNEVFLR